MFLFLFTPGLDRRRMRRVGKITRLLPATNGNIIDDVKIIKDYLGRNVRLTDERLEHILEHPEMQGLESLLDAIVAEPELVIESRSDNSVLIFYRLLPRTIVGVKWCCVAVKYKEDDAFILTAYLTDQPKKGVQRWPPT